MAPPHRQLRVLMTCDAVGGVWVYATGLARGLARRGHRVHLVTLGPAPSPDKRKAIDDVAGVTLEITDLALEWIDPEGVDLERAALRLRTIEAAFAPDVVHLNGYREALVGWSAPMIVVAHSCVRSWWKACRRSDPDEPRWRPYVRNVAVGLATANAWVAPTAAFAETMATLYSPSRRARVIHNGAAAARRSVAAKAPMVLAAGRLWDEAKNVRGLAQAAARLDWPVLIAGDRGPSAPGGHENVCWLGALPRAALLEQMARAGVFASCALYEPFGLAVLESAQRGCALVLSDIPTFRELWDGAALFVDPREHATTVAQIDRLTRDPALRDVCGDAARRRAARYSLDAMTQSYLALYEEVNVVDSRVAERPRLELAL